MPARTRSLNPTCDKIEYVISWNVLGDGKWKVTECFRDKSRTRLCPRTPVCPRSPKVAQKVLAFLLGALCVFGWGGAVINEAHGNEATIRLWSIGLPLGAPPLFMAAQKKIFENDATVDPQEFWTFADSLNVVRLKIDDEVLYSGNFIPVTLKKSPRSKWEVRFVSGNVGQFGCNHPFYGLCNQFSGGSAVVSKFHSECGSGIWNADYVGTDSAPSLQTKVGRRKNWQFEADGGVSRTLGSICGYLIRARQSDCEGTKDHSKDSDDDGSGGRKVVVPSVDRAPDRAPKGDYFTGGAVFLGGLLVFATFAVLLDWCYARAERR